MTDQIHIRDLDIQCIIGIFPKEREAKQHVVLNIALDVDTRAAAASDDIGDTVDYKELKDRLIEFVEESHYALLERLAEKVATHCLGTPGVQRAHVTVDKPGALTGARSVAVSIVRP